MGPLGSATALVSAGSEEKLGEVAVALAVEATGALWGLVVLTGPDGAPAVVAQQVPLGAAGGG